MHPSARASVPLCLSLDAFAGRREAVERHISAFAAASAAPRADSFDDYCRREADSRLGLMFDSLSGIAIQPVIGEMMAGAHPYYEACWGYFDTNRIQAAAEFCRETPGVRALVLQFDSPGGFAEGCEDAHAALMALRRDFPDMFVASYVSGECCSGAAWVATASEERHAGRGARIGSWGAYVVTEDTSGWAAKVGSEFRLFTDGKFKGMGADGVPWTKDWYAYVELLVADISIRFKSVLTEACPRLTPDLMQGQSFTASRELEAGRVGDGWFLQTVPDISGDGGAPTFNAFLLALDAELRAAA